VLRHHREAYSTDGGSAEPERHKGQGYRELRGGAFPRRHYWPYPPRRIMIASPADDGIGVKI